MTTKKKLLLGALGVVVVVGGFMVWRMLAKPTLPPGFAGGNGRLEAQQVDVAAKYQGRLKSVLVNEGDTVDANQVVAVIDTDPLEAQLRAAQARIVEAQNNVRTANAQVKAKQAEVNLAATQYQRSKALVAKGAVSAQERDSDLAQLDVTRADLTGLQSQVVRAQSAIDAATAESEALKAQIADNTLKAPLRARVQTRMAEPGEVLAPGGKVFSLLDLTDVYMYVYLPTEVAGRVTVGAEARIVLDAAPNFPISAVVSYISPNAQFTPKSVETAEERHNLTFRVKLQLNNKERLRQYEQYVKAGIPGMGYVRWDNSADWPKYLQLRPVTDIPWAATGSPDTKPTGSTDSK